MTSWCLFLPSNQLPDLSVDGGPKDLLVTGARACLWKQDPSSGHLTSVGKPSDRTEDLHQGQLRGLHRGAGGRLRLRDRLAAEGWGEAQGAELRGDGETGESGAFMGGGMQLRGTSPVTPPKA